MFYMAYNENILTTKGLVMKEHTNLLNKKVLDLTVKEVMGLTAATPFIMFGGAFAAMAIVGVANTKFIGVRKNRKNKIENEK